MMRDFSALSGAWLGGTNFKIAIHRDRIAVDDFTVESASNGQRQRSFPAGGWA
jgi:hypothetical protein